MFRQLITKSRNVIFFILPALSVTMICPHSTAAETIDKTKYITIDEITPDMVGQELVFEVDHRETGTMLDAFLFVDVTSGLLPTNGEGPDGDGFFGTGDEIDILFGLSNLGFDCPENVETMTPEVEEAIRAFQRANSLEETGQVDQTTRERLQEIHGG